MIYQDFNGYQSKTRFILGAISHGSWNDCSNQLPGIFVNMADPSVLEFVYKEVFGENSTFKKN